MHSLSRNPALQAQLDWMQQGSFFPDRYQGEQLAQYLAAQKAIEKQWDNQSE